MGQCLTREVEDPQLIHTSIIEATLVGAGWKKITSEAIQVLNNTSQVTAVQVDSDRVYMQLRLNAAILPTRIYNKLYTHLTSRRYKPVALYPTGHTEFMFLRAIVEKPCSLVVDLQSSRDKLLPSSARVFLGAYAVCVVPEGVAFLRAELQDIILVRWNQKIATVGLSYTSDETHGIVVSLADKGVFKLCFKQKGIETETLNAHQMVRRLQMASGHNCVASLEAIEDRGPGLPSNLSALLTPSCRQFDPRWNKITPDEEVLWWVRDNPTEKVLVLKCNQTIYVCAVDAGKTKYTGVFTYSE